MKIKSVKFLPAFFLMFCTSCFLQAQKEIDYVAEGGLVQFNLFHFVGSQKYEIIFHVSETMENLSLKIKSYISSGELSIEISDPKGEKQGNFSVQGSINSTNSFNQNTIRKSVSMNTSKMRIEKNPWTFGEENFKIYGMGEHVAQASISRDFKIPMKGNWEIEIVCLNARGLFTIESNFKLFDWKPPTKSIKGTVTDSNNRPLAGAIIVEKGTSRATITDNDGNFTILLLDYTELLEIHFKGMISKEVAIGDQTKLSIILEEQKK